MKIAVGVGFVDQDAVDFVTEAERLGADSVWAPEAWGYDALTPLAFLAARTTTIRLATGIAQIGARTPAMLAMSAMSMQVLSRGRFLLGLGTSGPQVMEGWHGVSFDAPVQATRETIDIVRMAARGDRVAYDGRVYQLPRPGGAGRSIRSMAPPVEIPIYLASLGPRNLRLTGELADGWLGNTFMAETASVFLDDLAAGAAAAGRSLADIDVVIPAGVEFTDDVDEASRRHARGYAFTMGAMGSKDQNFYNAAFARQGYGDDARAVQELWLDGRRDEAADRVPVEIGFRTNLLGPASLVKERLALYRDVGVTTIQAKLAGSLDERLATLGQLVELANEV